MKKLLLIVMALMTAIMLTACGGNGDAVTTGDVTEDITPADLPVTVASEDVTDVIPDETEATEATTEESAVTTAPESETEAATTTTSESTTAATTTTATTTTAATTTTKATTTEATTTVTTTVDEDEEEVDILWEEGIDRDEFEAMFGVGDDSELNTDG
ncbi:MAG: hypothetical protein LUF29_02330 [Oscillospiraceae bacterium]|nr:hypothetical protein [Oscillospiraceae bacterium]